MIPSHNTPAYAAQWGNGLRCQCRVAQDSHATRRVTNSSPSGDCGAGSLR